MYQGQLPNAVATIATVPGGKSWVIHTITAVNNDTSARTFSLYNSGTAAANIITPLSISLPASGGAWEWSDMSICLAAADTIAGLASVASKVTVTIWGDEVT